jgi:insertion element IS1 protein InsB
MIVLLYTLSRASFNFMARLFNVWISQVYRWCQRASELLPDMPVTASTTEIIFDEMWHFIKRKKNKLWVIKALDKRTRRTIAWVTGGRDEKTFRRLYDKVKHLHGCMYYTDDWSVFVKVLPPSRHWIGKQYTSAIERDNSNTRHYLGRFNRRTKIVSKSEDAVNWTLKLWCGLTNPAIFQKFQTVALSLYQ